MLSIDLLRHQQANNTHCLEPFLDSTNTSYDTMKKLRHAAIMFKEQLHDDLQKKTYLTV
jgi:hypothetical protein